jgi:hypothetical protein
MTKNNYKDYETGISITDRRNPVHSNNIKNKKIMKPENIKEQELNEEQLDEATGGTGQVKTVEEKIIKQ